MTIVRSGAGRLTVRYLPSGHVEIGCTLTGDNALISAADIDGMLTEIRKFVAEHPCCADA